ncbi:MAG TPA: hypothetical protein VGN75_17675 [Kaistia sp.]|nr:hypothetical protein [Kaistia sp.]
MNVEAHNVGKVAAEMLPIQPGDRLWVRETSKPIPASRPGGYFVEGSPFFGRDFFYRADADCPLWADGPWKPSIHMPRRASRLTLTVTDVRVELLQDISEADARAEGVFVPEAQYAQQGHRAPVLAYAGIWEDINGPRSWEANPWVAAYTFTVARHNIDNPTGEA